VARVIILAIPDNEDAERWARDMLSCNDSEQTVMPPVSTRIEAMIARPTQACQGSHTRSKPGPRSMDGFTRTQKFGWFVCGVCKRPAKAVVQNFIRNMLGGYNDLLPTLIGGEPTPPPWTKETLTAVQKQQSR
jgi:hypothetical protein